MEDMEHTLEQNGSTIKKIISNELSYHAEDCEELASIIATTLELIIWSSA